MRGVTVAIFLVVAVFTVSVVGSSYVDSPEEASLKRSIADEGDYLLKGFVKRAAAVDEFDDELVSSEMHHAVKRAAPFLDALKGGLDGLGDEIKGTLMDLAQSLQDMLSDAGGTLADLLSTVLGLVQGLVKALSSLLPI